MKDKKQLTSPCGLDCFNCDIYKENITDEMLQAIHKQTGVKKEDIPCLGCRAQDGKHFHLQGGCPTLDCTKNRGVEICSDCTDFPCALLAPLAKGADFYPHNMKVYNLCRIRLNGIESWIKEARDIRRAYYTREFKVGLGQSK